MGSRNQDTVPVVGPLEAKAEGGNCAAVDGSGRRTDPVELLAARAAAGVWNWDLATGVMAWSPAFWRQLDARCERNELLFAEFRLRIHPDDRPEPGEIEGLVAKGVAFERTLRMIMSDGRLRWLELKGEPLFEAGRAHAFVMGVAIDVTARREALQSLENSVGKLDALRSATSDAVVLVHADGSLAEPPAQSSYVAIIGFGRHKRCWLDIVHADDRRAVETEWQRAVAEGRRFVAKFRVQSGLDRSPVIAVRGVPVAYPDGRAAEWALIVGDIDSGTNDADERLTGAQIRAARGILRWSVRDLALAAKLSIATIRRIEETDGCAWRGDEDCRTLRTVLERSGVEFLFPASGKPGARPR